MANIMVHEVETRTGLYHRYPREQQPQHCFVQLDCDEEDLSAGYDPEVGGGIPFAVFHGRTLRWSIPVLLANAANALLEQVAVFAERVVDGYECRWDGSNHVGVFDDDAKAAIEEIADLCREDFRRDLIVSASSAEDWLRRTSDAELDITPATTDEQLDVIADTIEHEVSSQDIDILEGLSEYLRKRRDESKAIWGCTYHDHDLDEIPRKVCTCEGDAWAGGEKLTRAEAEEAAKDHVGERLSDGVDFFGLEVVEYRLVTDVNGCRIDFRCAPVADEEVE
jgi:hypothetical protein